MFIVKLFNGETETLIHAPFPEKDVPHLLNLPYKESLSKPDFLSFLIPINNPGFNLINGLNTKVKVYDIRDNSIVFSGRVMPTKDGMTSDGQFHKEITCEGALAYLNDTNTRRWHFANNTPSEILYFLLARHNETVDTSRQIYLGIVDVYQPITIDTNYESTLNAVITKVKNILGGDIRVQDRDGHLYLDYLQAQGANNNVEVRIGNNLKEITREYDPSDITTRIIPLGYGEGINQLDITDVNSGVEYIQDVGAVNTYGVIEGVVTNKDIQEPNTLKIYGTTVLNEKKQPKFTYTQTALDLSVLIGHENEKYEIGDTIHTIVDVINVDVYSRVIERDRDLIIDPWNPKLTISTRPITLTDQIIDLKQRNLSLENAPQGSTYIDTYGHPESLDPDHPFQLPVWLSPDILNVNRVRLHIDGQRYRAYERGMAAGGGVALTTAAGGGGNITSASGGGSTKTTSGGGGTTTSSGSSSATSSGSSSSSTTDNNNVQTAFVDRWGPNGDIEAPNLPINSDEDIMEMEPMKDAIYPGAYLGVTWPSGQVSSVSKNPLAPHPIAMGTLYAWVDLWKLQHKHVISSHVHGMLHTHNINHTHVVSIGDHIHVVDIPDHTHMVTLLNHIHNVEIQNHIHSLQYGIFEDTYPKDVYVKINGVTVAGPYGNGSEAFSVDIDLTPYISIPGATYNLEISSSQNGRVNAYVSIQAFIQAK